MLPSMVVSSSSEPLEDTDHRATQVLQITTWPTLPKLCPLTGSTILGLGRRFFVYSPETILKLGTDEGEAVMTKLAYNLLGPVVPRLEAFVSIVGPPADQGILITHKPGVALVELWPTLSSVQRTAAKTSLVRLLVRMRAACERFDYYGRPGAQPYVIVSEFGPHEAHDFCRTRSDWDASRLRALHSSAADIDVQEDRIRALERVQHETGAGGVKLVDSPVLTHGDLSDRNILLDPTTLEVSGFIDWELANVAPAYFEYAAARLSGGHQPEWRKELLEVLRDVLRIECEHEVAQSSGAISSQSKEKGTTELYSKTLAAWNALVNVERPAQGYSDDCYWTFENDFQAPSAVEELAEIDSCAILS